MPKEPKDLQLEDETHYGTQGLLLHVFKDVPSGDYEVWWNLDTDFDGSCIGSGVTRSEAINDAYGSLSAFSVVLDKAATVSRAGAGD